MDMTLETLLDNLEKQAGFVKQASDDSDKDEKDKKDKKDEKDKKDGDKEEKDKDEKSKSLFGAAKEELKEAEKDVEKAEQTKEAQVAGADFANEIMQKVASLQITQTKENEMNKQASAAGSALAAALLEKLANAGDVTTVNGIPEGVVPNKNQVDVAQTVAEQDATIKPMPTGDGIKNTGTINQIFDAIVADALGQGAATPTEINHVSSSQAEGAVEAHAVPNQVGESVEKTAAVVSLVNSGYDFDEAVDMVKAAAEQIEFEEGEQVKQAALASLIDSGVDFSLATALVKSAGVGQALGKAKTWAQDQAVKASVGAENVAFGARNLNAGIAGRGVKQLAQNRLVQGAAAGTAVAGGAYALGREKQAAVSALCDAGIDFDSAVDLVMAKSQEIYGA